jgi:hypothetical protein
LEPKEKTEKVGCISKTVTNYENRWRNTEGKGANVRDLLNERKHGNHAGILYRVCQWMVLIRSKVKEKYFAKRNDQLLDGNIDEIKAPQRNDRFTLSTNRNHHHYAKF